MVSTNVDWPILMANLTTGSSRSVSEPTAGPLGLTTGLVLTMVISYQRDAKTLRTATRLLSACLALLTGVLLLSVLAVYRQLVTLVLCWQYGEDFRGVLRGTDAVWCVADPMSRPVISVLLTLQADGSDLILEHLRSSLAEAVATCPRLTHNRHLSRLGYACWLRSAISLHDRVRWMDEEAEVDLRHQLSRLANAPMPSEDTACWEVLVSKRPLRHERYPVLIRIHHALGDGAALLQLFVTRLARTCHQGIPSAVLPTSGLPMCNTNTADHLRKSTGTIRSKEVSSYSLSFVVLSALRDFLDTVILRTSDDNSLHGPSLSGQKILACYNESPSASHAPLLDIIKSIKGRMQGVRFTEVLLTALSASLQDYYTECGGVVPQDITVVLPITGWEPHTDLTNSFRLGLLTLPIRCHSISSRLRAVSQHAATLRRSRQFHINGWILRLWAALLPIPLLGRLLRGSPATLVISNMVGPTAPLAVAGHTLQDIVFWLPTKGTTGVGISVLSYAGRLHLGLLADTALLCTPEDAQKILGRMIDWLLMMNKVL